MTFAFLRQSTDLREGHALVHWAAQVVASVGSTLAEAQDDFSHTALLVEEGRLGVRLKNVEVWLDGGGALELSRGVDARMLPLAGLSLDDALGELAAGLRTLALEVDTLKRPEHELPAHGIAQGEPFSTFPTESIEVLRWLDAGMAALQSLPSEFGTALVWPHHLDVARLWTLSGEGEESRSIGIGLSSGDASYAEPYLYVTPWPYPSEELKPLAHGHWHREGWTGAVLTGTEILASKDRDALVSRFIEEARDAAHRALIS